MKYQYFKSQILLVINARGELRKLFTPFRVQALATCAWVYVDEILSTEKDELIFMVNNQPHPYDRFRIIIQF